MNKLMNGKTVLAIALAGLVAACGGGSGSSNNTAANQDPQGYWAGPTSTGYTADSAILDNGEVWGVYTSGSTIYGAVYGHASVNGNNITITGSDFNFLTNSTASGTYTGTFVPKSSMSLKSGNGATVSATYSSQYDTPATAAAITGTWSFTGRSANYSLVPGRVTIDSNGNFTLSQTNCTSIGNISPRPGGKNVYNVHLTSSGSGCAAGQNLLSGIAYLDTTVTPNKFLSLALTPSKDNGLIVIGTKQ